MICLGIECTAHTFGIGIMRDKEVLANERDVYKPVTGKGIIPVEAANHHTAVADGLLKKSLDSARISMKDVNVIAISCGPGMPPCLLAGLNFAKKIAGHRPLVPVNHCIAHIEIGRYDTGCKDPIALYVSGGNTQIIGLESRRYVVFGETLDIGIGNAFDKVGRELGMPNPAGPEVEKAAVGGKYLELPYTVKGMDLAFSGLVTAALKKKDKNTNKPDLCYSFTETAFSMLCEVTERALAHTFKKEILVIGGVAQSKRLLCMLNEMGKPHNVKAYAPKPEWCGDNGAMITYAGMLAYKSGQKLAAHIRPRWRTDNVDIT